MIVEYANPDPVACSIWQTYCSAEAAPAKVAAAMVVAKMMRFMALLLFQHSLSAQGCLVKL